MLRSARLPNRLSVLSITRHRVRDRRKATRLVLATLLTGALLAIGVLPRAYAQAAGVDTPLNFPDATLLVDPAWARPGYAYAAAPFLKKTRYLLALDVNYDAGKIIGKARIYFVNTTPDPLSSAVFRLYPNHPLPPAYGGAYTAARPRLVITALQVNGADAPIRSPDQYKTVLDVPFPAVLCPGDGATIDAEYTLQYAAPSDLLDVREGFPMLALYDRGTGGAPGTWRTEILTKSLDFVPSETALYAVSLRAPNNAALYATGSIVRTEPQGQRVVYQIATGPVRDFVFQLTRGWGFFPAANAPIPIDMRYKGRLDAATEMAGIAAQAFAYFDKTFGPYIYAHLTILSTAYPTGGEEYPTLVFIDNERDTAYRRFITAHEVAHQWFYGIAGNDIARHAWLDESLAQISLYLFYLDIYGADVAEREWQYILLWANRLKDPAKPIDTPVESFASFSEYMIHNYGLGPVFLRQIGEKMGWARFKAGMASYFESAQLQLGTPAQFFTAMQGQAPEIDLAPLFCAKMGTNCKPATP